MTLPPVLNFATDSSDTQTTPIDDVFDNNYDITFGEQLAIFLYVYYTPVLIVLGCLGNLISTIVFYKSKLRVQSTSLYLSALALSDTIFLLQLLLPWLELIDASSSLYSANGFCQLFVYLSYVTCSYSSWLVAAFTFERFAAVVYPLQSNAMSTVKRAQLVIGSLAVSALLVNVPVLRFAMPSGDSCGIDELLMEHAARFNVFDTVFSFTLPLVVIIALNACIVWHVRESRARVHLMSNQRKDQRITRMLLIVSSVFVLLNLPAYTLRIIVYADIMSEHEQILAVLQHVSVSVFYTNFGINFLLYCMTGKNFRRALQETFPWLRWRCELPSGLIRGHAADRPARSSSVLGVRTDEQQDLKDEPAAGVDLVRLEPATDVERGAMLHKNFLQFPAGCSIYRSCRRYV